MGVFTAKRSTAPRVQSYVVFIVRESVAKIDVEISIS